jgi:phage terminase large subunit
MIDLGPEHDWASHAADAFGMMAIVYEEPTAKKPKPFVQREKSWLRI